LIATTGCAIDIETIATISGDHANRAGIGLVTEDRILLVSNLDLAVIEVFDLGGRWVRSVGGRGQGPGEFMGIMELRQLPDGRIAAIDGRAARISFLDGDLMFLKTVSVPVFIYPHGAVAVENGEAFVPGAASRTFERYTKAAFGERLLESEDAWQSRSSLNFRPNQAGELSSRL
jgi:hypothetical protein